MDAIYLTSMFINNNCSFFKIVNANMSTKLGFFSIQFKKKLRYIGAGHFQKGRQGSKNLTINFMWPDTSKFCVKFYLLIISIST